MGLKYLAIMLCHVPTCEERKEAMQKKIDALIEEALAKLGADKTGEHYGND